MNKKQSKLSAFIKLIRVRQYTKNVLVFLPLFFSGSLLDLTISCKVLVGFIVFSVTASIVYIINDLNDVAKDRKHPTKRYRPIASGAISKQQAVFIAILFFVAAAVLAGIFLNLWAIVILAIYLVINILYSAKLKDIPLVDVAIVAAGFYLRLAFGGVVSGIELSVYITLTILFVSLFMAFGKRRNELVQRGALSRKVLKYYTREFLDKNMYVMVALSITFYALWVISTRPHDQLMIATIPVVVSLMIRYSYVIEKDTSDGDPSEVLLSDKTIIILGFMLAVMMAIGLYI